MDYGKLYEACYMQVYSFVMTLCADRHQAEEITQETFYRAMTARERAAFRDNAKEVTWLCAIAKNLWLDEKRKNARVGQMPEDVDSGDDVLKTVADEDLSFRIHQILHALEEPYKEVFQLRVFGELSFAAIGALWGKTETWARVTFHRARLKIQERMNNNGT